jgi:hypothetical protein
MLRATWQKGLFALGLVLVLAGLARAARVSTFRTAGERNTGTRLDITVPYLTSGRTAFFTGYVAPRIYSSPILDDPLNPGAKPVFNLPFYGAVQSFGDRSNGATPRPR